MVRGATQPASSAATTSVTPSPARGSPVGHGAARGGAQSSGGLNCFYAMKGRRSLEASLNFVTVPPYVAMEFGIEPEHLHDPFSVSTPVSESIMAAQVYRDCVFTVRGRDTVDDLIELRMVDFNVLIGMDWLYSCLAKHDCRTRTVRFIFPNESVIEWKGDDVVPKGRFISYLKATTMINKGCIYHLVRVTDIDAKAPTLESVPVVNELSENGTGRVEEAKGTIKGFVREGLHSAECVALGLTGSLCKKERWVTENVERIKVDLHKISAVKNCPRPTTPTEIHSFLGLAGYYKKFVKGFSTLSSLFTKLTQKPIKFQWSDACERSFQELK
ncbi:uncharacterized protein [Nicotiana tomentosiformis]|uniref:uncharacterized protein n=1 Tax=Nicotiana tomentosiformis TaxID=4098 RepID=UPI00388C8658